MKVLDVALFSCHRAGSIYCVDTLDKGIINVPDRKAQYFLYYLEHSFNI